MRSIHDKAKYALGILRAIEEAVEAETPRIGGESLLDWGERVRIDVAHVVRLYCMETIDDRLELVEGNL